MATGRVERRLAAILAADVAGYSRLMERDEAGTLAAEGSWLEGIFRRHLTTRPAAFAQRAASPPTG